VLFGRGNGTFQKASASLRVIAPMQPRIAHGNGIQCSVEVGISGDLRVVSSTREFKGPRRKARKYRFIPPYTTVLPARKD
jgi:hypothetical protein